MEPMVTIITACYNGERFIDTYANCILSQTYKNIEVVFVDDGSTDQSAEKIKNYVDEFRRRNIKISYFYQENQGQAVATNVALKQMTGEYFCLYDIDDMLESDCIEKRTTFLVNHPDCGAVRSNVWKIYEGESDTKLHFLCKHGTENEEWIFEDVLNNKISAFPIFYMYRTSSFDSAYPLRQIYASRYTQDVQIILPISYFYKCGFIDEYLGTYLYRRDSHSHSYSSCIEKLELWNGWEDVWMKTIEQIRITQKEKDVYIYIVKQRINKIRQWLIMELLWETIDILPMNVKNKKYFVFGASNEGRSLVNMLKKKNLQVLNFLDNDKLKHGITVDGIRVIGINASLIRSVENSYILIASELYKNEIEEQLEKIGLYKKINFSFYQKYIFDCIHQCM